MAFVLLFSLGCDPDSTGGGGGGGGVVLNPEISLNSGAGLVSFNQELPLSTTSFIVNLAGNDGDALLRDLAILENGLTIPANRLNFRTGQTANSPLLIPAANQQGFTYEIEITPEVAAAGDVTYEFRLTDVDCEIGSTSVIITYTSNLPLVELLVQDGFVSGDATITSASTNFQTRVLLTATEDSIATLAVLENGTLMDTSQLAFISPSFTAANPLTLLPEESLSSAFSIRIAPVGAANTTRTYTFRATDVNGIVGETTATIVFDTPMTDLSFDTTGVFFNASGSEDGGLDLDNGMAVTFNSTDAEIQDEGIDLNAAGENWRTQVSSVNDAVLRVADLSAIGDGLTWDDVLLTSQITAAFDAGTVPDGNDNFPDADGDTSASEIVTQPLQEGDVLAIQRAGRTYLVRIDTITFVGGSNNDSYSVSIKY